jgi:hypothetical protein
MSYRSNDGSQFFFFICFVLLLFSRLYLFLFFFSLSTFLLSFTSVLLFAWRRATQAVCCDQPCSHALLLRESARRLHTADLQICAQQASPSRADFCTVRTAECFLVAANDSSSFRRFGADITDGVGVVAI